MDCPECGGSCETMFAGTVDLSACCEVPLHE